MLTRDTGEYNDTVEAWYSERTGQPDDCEQGDAITVTGMDEGMYPGALVQVYRRNSPWASVRLPTEYP
jgi:hypothetical protein